MYRIKLTIIPFLISSSLSCSYAGGANVSCASYLNTFFRLSIKERIVALPTYDLETQYQIYICGQQAVHPPATYLVVPFAKQGKTVGALLKTKIAQSQDDLTIHDIIVVFNEMKRIDTYDFKADDSLYALLREKVASMQDLHWKERSARMLE